MSSLHSSKSTFTLAYFQCSASVVCKGAAVARCSRLSANDHASDSQWRFFESLMTSGRASDQCTGNLSLYSHVRALVTTGARRLKASFQCHQNYVVFTSYKIHRNAHTWTLARLSLRFNGHFPGEPGLAGTRLSPFWILLELRLMEVMVTRRAKLKSNCHHQQTSTQFLQSGCPSCRPTNSVRALQEKGAKFLRCT